MLRHLFRAASAFAIFLIAIPILAPALQMYSRLANEDGFCAAPGPPALSLNGIALADYHGRCAAIGNPQPPYTVNPYHLRLTLHAGHTEAGRFIMPPDYVWYSEPPDIFRQSPITQTFAGAGAGLFWLLALAATLVVALRPK